MRLCAKHKRLPLLAHHHPVQNTAVTWPCQNAGVASLTLGPLNSCVNVRGRVPGPNPVYLAACPPKITPPYRLPYVKTIFPQKDQINFHLMNRTYYLHDVVPTSPTLNISHIKI